MRLATASRLWLVVLTTAISGCAGDQEPSRGNALQPAVNVFELGMRPLRVGEEFSVVFVRLRNVSDEEIVIKTIETFSEPEEIAVVERFFLTTGTGTLVTSGTYSMFPPVEPIGESGDTCLKQELDEPEGTILPPNQGSEEGPFIVAVVRTVGEGRGDVKYADITYRQGSDDYVERLEFTLSLRVREEARPYDPNAAERRCMARTS
jgi:hypothetical protein